jgi:hypothetical protein
VEQAPANSQRPHLSWADVGIIAVGRNAIGIVAAGPKFHGVIASRYRGATQGLRHDWDG